MKERLNLLEHAVVLNTVIWEQEVDCGVLIAVEEKDLKIVLEQFSEQNIDEFLDSYVYEDVWELVSIFKERKIDYFEIQLSDNQNSNS